VPGASARRRRCPTSGTEIRRRLRDADMSQGRRSLGDPVPRSLLPPPDEPTPSRRKSRRSREPAVAERFTSSRSIPSSRTRASRARWSYSTLGTFLFRRFSPSMTLSTTRVLRMRRGGRAPQDLAAIPNGCDLLHISAYKGVSCRKLGRSRARRWLGTAVAWPLTTRAQRSRGIPRIGGLAARTSPRRATACSLGPVSVGVPRARTSARRTRSQLRYSS